MALLRSLFLLVIGSVLVAFMTTVALPATGLLSKLMVVDDSSAVQLNNVGLAAPDRTSQPSTITLNQQNVKYGERINFTEVFPKRAAIKIGKQQLLQPATQVDCYRDAVRIFSNHTSVETSTQNGDGTMTGITYFMTLGGTFNNYSWTSGGAECYATLYYFDRENPSGNMVFHFLAQTVFTVLP